MKKKTKLTILFAFLLCVLLIVSGILTSCSQKPPALDLGSLKNEEDRFAWPGLTWGMSLIELEEALDYQFDMEKPDLYVQREFPHDYRNDPNYSSVSFAIENYVTVFGKQSKVGFQFFADKLMVVSVFLPKRNSGADLEKLSEQLLTELERLYGDYTADESNSEFKHYYWSHNEPGDIMNRLHVGIMHNSKGEILSIDFDVHYLNPQWR